MTLIEPPSHQKMILGFLNDPDLHLELVITCHNLWPRKEFVCARWFLIHRKNKKVNLFGTLVCMWPSSCYKIARSRAHVQSLISMIAWPIWTIIILHLSIVLNATDFELDLNQNQYPDHEYVGKSFYFYLAFG